jgi:hypothetical protein
MNPQAKGAWSKRRNSSGRRCAAGTRFFDSGDVGGFREGHDGPRAARGAEPGHFMM